MQDGQITGSSTEKRLYQPTRRSSHIAFRSSPLADCLEQVRKWGGREAGKQGRHFHPFLIRCLEVFKDDDCLTEGNHKSIPLLQVWSVSRAKGIPFGSVQRGKQQNGHLKPSWVSRSLLNNVGY